MVNVLKIQRKGLFLIAGIIWTMVGLMLCSRAIIWATEVSFSTELLLEGLGILFATVGYTFGFSKIVKRNIKRIQTLPHKVSAFAFTPTRGYIMIAVMITMGILLRSSALPKYYLVIPYTSMGGMLLIGSIQFYWQYLKVKTN